MKPISVTTLAVIAVFAGLAFDCLGQERFRESFQIAPLPPVPEEIPPRPAQLGVFADERFPRDVLPGPTAVDHLVGQALDNNAEIKAARYQAQMLMARVPQAKSLPDPSLMTTVFLEEIQTAAGPQQLAMSLSQKIPWFGKRDLRGQAAYYDAMAAYSRVSETELKVIEQIKRAYFDLYFVQQAARETEQLTGPLEDVISVAKAKYEASDGKFGLQSVFQAQVELAKLKTELVKLEAAGNQAQARLAGVMSLPPGTMFEASASLPRSRVENRVESLVGLAQTCQPAYEAYRREMARDRAAVDLARRDYYPDVTTSLNWNEIGQGGLSPVSNGRDALSIGVGVNLPIYRHRLDAAVREARNKLSATSRQYKAAKDRFQTDIAALHAQFQEHHRTLQILEKDILPRADETLKLTLDSYRIGRADFQQLMDIYRTLLQYRIELHRHLAQREQAVASLERAVGCGLASNSGPRCAASGKRAPTRRR